MDISIKGEIARRNLKYNEVAKAVGIKPQTFYRKLDKNSFSLQEAAKIFRFLGIKVAVVEG
ncbi:helix-turn-helix domain-containing protein [Selenomonas ruminantium]|uniref:HTH cro/C1-type domain-containing protein n=1 Tax=Selenomonas ruminantium TaxID=971 RepID=A0A1H0MZ17_SELRU|nr:helix-turn-helix domain-containing protein [Selenomonas ruminantium]SDO85360.1 hypothetical protein SAMN05216366_10294 [Selenomonas ruminantium]